MPRRAGTAARLLRVRGVVQGVGFRPFVYRRANQLGITGWVRNGDDGVEIHAEGNDRALDRLIAAICHEPPPAARIESFEEASAEVEESEAFVIRASQGHGNPTVRVSPDLAPCAACLAELLDPGDPRRHGYPYLNCTDCGPRFSIILGLPYDRAQTTMRAWPLCADCLREYEDPNDRRFHAQPTACWRCGPRYRLESGGETLATGRQAIPHAAAQLASGGILAVKGVGGYHLMCDAEDAHAVTRLRTRKFRKEKPFAVLARDLSTARDLIELNGDGIAMLECAARPIVLAPSKRTLEAVAPGNRDLGVMLPSTPLHHLLFAAGAPRVLVATSANASSEPIAYQDDDARQRLAGLADAFLTGEREVARRVDDSVVRLGSSGSTMIRRARGHAPASVARLPSTRPILALGADLKNTITLVVEGEAMMSQHLGDLGQLDAFDAFRETVDDLLRLYAIDRDDLLVVHDAHPQYRSTEHAAAIGGEHRAVQHHRAHAASLLAEHDALDARVVAVVLDGTGWGDDGSIWGGELFAGSVRAGLERVAHLRPFPLPGGDAAARHPVQAAAGLLFDAGEVPDLEAPPFSFPVRYRQARRLIEKDVRTFRSTSCGRLFDAAAALLGFTRETTFEAQAAIRIEQLARGASGSLPALAMPVAGREIDPRPALVALADQRRRDEDPAELAHAFHRGLAQAIAQLAHAAARHHGADAVALSGGVMQNSLLVDAIEAALGPSLPVWKHRRVPPNDGGISLGQAALAAIGS